MKRLAIVLALALLVCGCAGNTVTHRHAVAKPLINQSDDPFTVMLFTEEGR